MDNDDRSDDNDDDGKNDIGSENNRDVQEKCSR